MSLAMPCVLIGILLYNAHILKSVFIHLNFFFVNCNYRLIATILRTEMLRRSWVSKSLWAHLARHQAQIIVVIPFVSYKFIFIHFFFSTGHVSVCFKCLSIMNLSIKFLFVLQHGLVFLTSLTNIELIVEHAYVLCLRGFILTQGLIISCLLSLIHIHLFK